MFKDTMENVIQKEKKSLEQLFELIDKIYSYNSKQMIDKWLESTHLRFVTPSINDLFNLLDKELLIGEHNPFDIYNYGVGQPMFFLSGIRDDHLLYGTGDYYNVRM